MFEQEPQRDQFEKVRLLGPSPGGGYSFETQRGDIYHGKPSLAGGHSPGDRLTVGYLSPGGMREPVIVDGWASTIVRYPKLASLPFANITLFGLWSVPEGQPNLPLGIGAGFTPGVFASVASLARTEDSSAVTYAVSKNRTDGAGLLATTSATGLVLVAGYKRLANFASGQSSIFRIQETTLAGSILQNIDLPSRSNLYGWGESSRYFGHLFYWDQGVNKPFIYTAVHGSAIVSVNRANASAPVVTPIKTLPRNSGFLDGPWNLAGPYLADCKYQGYQAEGDYPHTDSDRCKLQFYKQEDSLAWTPLSLVDAMAFVPSGSGSLLQVYPVGLASAWGGHEDRTSTTETQTADGSTESFTLPNLPFRVTEVRLNGSPVAFQVVESVVSLLGLPASGDSVAIDYEYATGSKIESEFALPILPSRWPHLALGTKREWWWYLSYRKESSAGFKILATDAATGATSEVFASARGTLWTGEETAPGIVSSQFAAAQAAATASRAPGQPETLFAFYQEIVEIGGRTGILPGHTQFLQRGYFLAPSIVSSGVSQGFCLAQPALYLRELDGSDWLTVAAESPKSWSRQVASGCFNSSVNHYQIYSELVAHASGIFLTGLSVDRELIEERNFVTWHSYYTAEMEEGFFFGRAPDEFIDPDWIYNGAITISAEKIYADHSEAGVTTRYLWKTWLVSHDGRTKAQRFKVDISHRYNYPPDDLNGAPLLAPVHQWACVGEYLVALRDDFWNKTGDVVAGNEVEPSLYIYNRATGALVASRNLHPTSDAARDYNAGGMRPYLRCHANSVTVFQHWKLTSDSSTASDGHSLHVISLPDLAILKELWATGTKPAGFPCVAEAYNSVSADGHLFWLNDLAEIGKV